MEPDNEATWVDPTPGSFLLVFAITFGGWAVFTGQVNMFEALPVFGYYFIAFGVYWLIAAIIDFRIGDMIGGAINGVFGVLLGLGPGLAFILDAHFMAREVALDTTLEGYFLLFTGIVFFVFAIAAGSRSWLLTVMLAILGAAFLILGYPISGLTTEMMWFDIGGWLLLIAGVIALYAACSFIFNEAYERTILPLGGPLFK